MAGPRKQMHLRLSQMENQKQIQKKKASFIRTFPYRVIKFFAGFLLFIPLTAIAFGAHCFQANEWPWSDRI